MTDVERAPAPLAAGSPAYPHVHIACTRNRHAWVPTGSLGLTGRKLLVHILLISDSSFTSPGRPNLSMSIASSPSFSLSKKHTQRKRDENRVKRRHRQECAEEAQEARVDSAHPKKRIAD